MPKNFPGTGPKHPLVDLFSHSRLEFANSREYVSSWGIIVIPHHRHFRSSYFKYESQCELHESNFMLLANKIVQLISYYGLVPQCKPTVKVRWHFKAALHRLGHCDLCNICCSPNGCGYFEFHIRIGSLDHWFWNFLIQLAIVNCKDLHLNFNVGTEMQMLQEVIKDSQTL